jgi:hypothetical protein
MDMLLFVNVPLLATPIVVAVAWWFWHARDRDVSRWRAIVLLVGLAAVTASAATYYGWLAYRLSASNSAEAFRLKELLANNVGIYLALAALSCAIVGKGGARIPVGVAGIMEIFLWSNIGIL